MIRLWTRLMMLCAVALVAVVVGGFWSRLTAGERYLLLDKARNADAAGFVDATTGKVKEQLAREQRRGVEAIREISGRAVDAAAEGAKAAVKERLDEQLNPSAP